MPSRKKSIEPGHLSVKKPVAKLEPAKKEKAKLEPARPQTAQPQPVKIEVAKDEVSLIARAHAGDLRAFNDLVLSYQSLVYNLAFRILGDSDSASDAAQEAFISAYQGISAYRGGSFKGWLLRIVTNACYDELRRRKRRPSQSLEETSKDADWAGPEAREIGGEESILEYEIEEAIRRGLATLPVEQRTILVLADIQGLSYEEIAQATATNPGTVKSRLSRARSALRDWLLAQGELLPLQYRLKAEGD